MTSDTQGAAGSSRAGVASKELRGRIRRIHLQALEQGTAMLEEGLAILEGGLELPDGGYVN